MRWSWIGIGLGALVSLFFISGCQSCAGDKQSDSGDKVRCDGNIFTGSSSSSSTTDNNICDLLDCEEFKKETPESVKVTLFNNSFLIFKTEVTNEQFALFLRLKKTKSWETGDGDTNDCDLDNGLTALCYDFGGVGETIKIDKQDVNRGRAKIGENYSLSAIEEDHPVNYVSWYAAREYCKALGWQLPTEEQWLEAAEGIDRKYPWGEQEPNCQYANYADKKSGKYCKGDTAKVKSYKLGKTPDADIWDLAGNVAEWTLTEIEDDDDKPRVVKGGNWYESAKYLKNSEKSKYKPYVTAATIGFRCVKKLEPKKEQ